MTAGVHPGAGLQDTRGRSAVAHTPSLVIQFDDSDDEAAAPGLQRGPASGPSLPARLPTPPPVVGMVQPVAGSAGQYQSRMAEIAKLKQQVRAKARCSL